MHYDKQVLTSHNLLPKSIDEVTKLNVLMPIREPAPWLEQTLEGLSNQTLQEWSLIAIIHGEDRTISKRIHEAGIPSDIVHVAETSTFSEVLNIGLTSCDAEYVARLDSDDIPMPMRFELQVSVLDQYATCAVVGSSARLIDELGNNIGVRRVPTDVSKIRKLLTWKNCIIHPSVMFRRSVILSLGGYDEQAIHVEDYDLWLRVAASHEIMNIETPLLAYRLHTGQITQTKSIPKSAGIAIYRSRLRLTNAQNKSKVFTHMKHFIWSLPQMKRRLTRD